MKQKAVAIIFLFFLFGCQSDETLQIVRQIVKQHPDLNKVLQHYATDSLKLKAAEFLIAGLPYYYTYEGDELEKYRAHFQLHSKGTLYGAEVIDSLRRKNGVLNLSKLITRSDLEISPDYLIENIDWAFKVWQEQPWGKHVSFDDFCEYILPYRIKDEPLKSWREKIYRDFNPLLDSIRQLPAGEDITVASKIVLDSISRRRFYFTSMFDNGPHVGPDNVEWRSGNCREFADIVIYIFRALGIPCGCDYMPLRGDNNVAHFWNFIKDNNGQSYYMYENKGPDSVHTFWGIKSKVYRQTFSVNHAMFKQLPRDKQTVHPTFRYPCFVDVTALYSGKYARTLSISAEQFFHKMSRDEPVYLCGASHRNWQPLVCAYPDKNGVTFEQVEGGVVFLVATYCAGDLVPLSPPFVFERESGEVRYFNPSADETEDITLLNKYHQLLESFPQRMINGVFEGSNRPDFRESDTLYIIKTLPLRLHNVVGLNSCRQYRYVRYMGPKKGYCNISEVSFYADGADTVACNGKVIGTPNGTHGDGSHDVGNVYDGDPYTSFDYYLPDGGWAGLDLGTPRTISKIVYTSRNRDNYIRKGDTYELFYFNSGRWQTLGIQVPQADSLLYTVPKGALLYLQNHSRGEDERIFEYTDGVQRYW
ncbi:MAG: hypothetical protein LBN06_10540 [Prevotellaceae bacterium]|jgi:hypothetical protein|nr:hypothetical protein [Prevotellaceae bacterium]